MNFKHFFLSHTKPEIINPYLVAYTPLVFIYAYNIEKAFIFSPTRIIIFIFIAITTLRLVLQKIITNHSQSSAIIIIILFFSFLAGHLARWLPYFELWRFNSFILSRNPLVFLVTCSLISFTCFLVIKYPWPLKQIHRIVAVSLILVIFINSLQIIWYLIKLPDQLVGAPLSNTVLSTVGLQKLPDIYYIILDGHARADVLKELYDYPESKLTAFLEDRGFYVAGESKANHVYTLLSLTTALNYNYIENLTSSFKLGEKNPTLLSGLIENNKAARRLKNLGYTYIIVGSGYFATEKSPLADVEYEYVYDFNNLELAFLRTNIFSRFLSYINLDPRTFHRNRILYEFNTLKEIPQDRRPTFTFAHILAPHPPFVFNENGDEVGKGGRFTLTDGYGSVNTKKEYKDGYFQQLLYIDKLLTSTLDEILTKSDTPPIIIIQSDHGPASEIAWQNHQKDIFLSDVIDRANPMSVFERTGILNAYYFPYQGATKLYASITPVNSFRLLFNHYFDGDFELLEDRTYIDR